MEIIFTIARAHLTHAWIVSEGWANRSLTTQLKDCSSHTCFFWEMRTEMKMRLKAEPTNTNLCRWRREQEEGLEHLLPSSTDRMECRTAFLWGWTKSLFLSCNNSQMDFYIQTAAIRWRLRLNAWEGWKYNHSGVSGKIGTCTYWYSLHFHGPKKNMHPHTPFAVFIQQ